MFSVLLFEYNLGDGLNNLTISIVHFGNLLSLPLGSRLAYLVIVLSSALLMAYMNCAPALSRFAVD
jgi:hypothetical protein